ncbi:MAG: enoyl-CoA hydratase/isomerase family protein [Actinobacteria bacterium]|nr:enoyl-CoA hydratase/isomerase family protein [Actinomycetota bacterium]
MVGTVLYERTGRIATITYNRPHAMNAVDRELRADLNAAWRTFRDDADAWVGIVTGAGRAFCAGADLNDPTGATSTGNADPTFWEMPSLSSLEAGLEIDKPTIAAVNGHCLGFGLTLATACDFVVASDRATFGFPEVRLGVPTVQGAVRLPHRIGWQHAMELLLTGERIDTARALEIGLVWKVVPHDDLMSEATRLAERLLAGAPLAVRATKEIARRGTELPLLDAIRFGETMRRVVAQTEDAGAFGRRRADDGPPTWTGR